MNENLAPPPIPDEHVIVLAGPDPLVDDGEIDAIEAYANTEPAR